MNPLFKLLLRHWLLAGLTLLSAALLGALAFIYLGLYNVAATGQHTAPVFWLTNTVMRHSIAQRAAELTPPALQEAARIERGLKLYVAHCEQCHGGPGVAPQPFALGLTPIPANLVETGRRWPASHIFWTAKYGIKMTGMPAWKYRLDDDQLWDLAAFIEHLPRMTPRDYRTRREGLARQPDGTEQRP
ncbi:c-type cytochrome [Pseudomonas sp. NCHU5208]|uniref:c-type cytochrome n=1 Tax=unclassified Pseudomonas TaxID=196821 RepID=UPI003F9DB402